MTDWGMEEIDAQVVRLEDGHLMFITGEEFVAAFAPGEWRGFVIAK